MREGKERGRGGKTGRLNGTGAGTDEGRSDANNLPSPVYFT